MIPRILVPTQLLPQEKFADFKPPEPFIPESIGHHREWIEACKTGGPTTFTLTACALPMVPARKSARSLEVEMPHDDEPHEPEPHTNPAGAALPTML